MVRVAIAVPLVRGEGVIRDDYDHLVTAFSGLWPLHVELAHPHCHIVELLLVDELLEWH